MLYSSTFPSLAEAINAANQVNNHDKVPTTLIIDRDYAHEEAITSSLPSPNGALLLGVDNHLIEFTDPNSPLFSLKGMNVTVRGLRFQGPGKDTKSVGIRFDGSFGTLIEDCVFSGFGTGIEVHTSGTWIRRCYFTVNGIGIHVIANPENGDPTTSTVFEKNWYEYCVQGLSIDSSGVAGGAGSHLSLASMNEVFQRNTGRGLYVKRANFHLVVINPHFEYNTSAAEAWLAYEFVDSQVTMLGGYWHAGEGHKVTNSSLYQFYGKDLTWLCPEGTLDMSPVRSNTHYYRGPGQYSKQLREISALASSDNGPATAAIRFYGVPHGGGINEAAELRFYTGYAVNSDGIHSTGRDVHRLTIEPEGAVRPAASNSFSLGTSSFLWSQVYSKNGVITPADEGDKTSVVDSPLGLKFVNALRPVAFKFKVGENKVVNCQADGTPVTESQPGTRTHFGLIAQDVKAAVEAMPGGIDFGGWVQSNLQDGTNTQGLQYDQFIAPLVKAVQELSAHVDKIQKRFDDADAQPIPVPPGG